MKKAIISGSTGLVGMAVAKHLSSVGVELLCLGRKKLSPDEVRQSFGVGSSYLSLTMDNISSLPSQAERVGWLSDEKTVFYNFAWGGDKRLTDGEFRDQLSNAVYSAESVRAAKKLGCSKFVNSGTIQETFVEEFLQGQRGHPYVSTQTNYALAKLAARNMSKMVAYLEKIDYVHTRLSAPLAPNLSQGNYIASTIKKIVEGEAYEAPENEQLFDIVLVHDVARAYHLIGQEGRNKADYFIGTSRPATLRQYFEQFERFIQGADVSEVDNSSVSQARLFDTQALHRDTGFVTSAGVKDIIQSVLQR